MEQEPKNPKIFTVVRRDADGSVSAAWFGRQHENAAPVEEVIGVMETTYKKVGMTPILIAAVYEPPEDQEAFADAILALYPKKAVEQVVWSA